MNPTRFQRSTRVLPQLALLALLVVLFGLIPQAARADGGARPTSTPTRTPTPTATITLQPTLFIPQAPLPLPAATSTIGPLVPTGLAPQSIIATLTAMAQPTPAPAPARRSLLAMCWPFAVGIILVLMIAGLVLLGRNP